MSPVTNFTTRLPMPLTNSLLSKASANELAIAGAPRVSTGGMGTAAPTAAPSGIDFASLMGQGVAEVNSLQNQSTQSVHELLTGGDVQPAEVFASVQKADMAFRMLLQVRNKLMQAYEEVNAIRI